MANATAGEGAKLMLTTSPIAAPMSVNAVCNHSILPPVTKALRTLNRGGTMKSGTPKPTTAACQRSNTAHAAATTLMTRRDTDREAVAILWFTASFRDFDIAIPIDRNMFHQRPKAVAARGHQTGDQHSQPDFWRVVGKKRIQHHGADTAIGAGPFRRHGPQDGRGSSDLESGKQVRKSARKQQEAEHLRASSGQNMHEFSLLRIRRL